MPNAKENPNRIDRAKLLKSIETVKIPKKNDLEIVNAEKDNEEKQ